MELNIVNELIFISVLNKKLYKDLNEEKKQNILSVWKMNLLIFMMRIVWIFNILTNYVKIF
jgi:hypothetical protein